MIIKYKFAFKRFAYLMLFAIVLSSCNSGTKSKNNKKEQQTEAKKPNILFLFTDDQSFNTIQALGNKEVSTPNMDKLVAQGTTFTHAHIMGSNNGAVCMPSRAMLMTGKYLQKLAKTPGMISPDDTTLPQVLQAAGYNTFGTGKWHNEAASFHQSFASGDNIFIGGMSNHLKVPLHKFDTTGEYKKEAIYYEDKFSSVLFREAAVNFLENYKEDKPFFAYVAFSSPHDPRMAPEAYQNKYNTQAISLPKNYQPIHPFDNGELIIRDENLLPRPRTKEGVKGEIASYYAMISEVDDNIGKILEALEKSGQTDNTIIVFAADNGLAAGQHGLLGKQNLYDHSVRVPLVICGPNIKRGATSESLVLLNDVFPTLADMAGTETPDAVDGTSLVPILEDTNKEIRESVFFMYKNFQRGVRTKDWKLIKYLVEGKQTTQLFEIRKDPLEMNNLANEPAYKDKVEEMTQLLQEWCTRSGDKVQLNKPDWGVKVIKSWAEMRKERGLPLNFKGGH